MPETWNVSKFWQDSFYITPLKFSILIKLLGWYSSLCVLMYLDFWIWDKTSYSIILWVWFLLRKTGKKKWSWYMLCGRLSHVCAVQCNAPSRSTSHWIQWETCLWGMVSTQTGQSNNNNQKSFVHFCACIRYMCPYNKGKVLFKIIPVYHGRENQIRQQGKSFSREHPWQGILFVARALDQGIYYITQETL